LVAGAPAMPDPWPREARDLFAELLLTGAAAISVIEALEHRGVVVRILPRGEPVRSRPQRNAFHRYTVDRHLLETVANAAALARDVSRPDLLLLGALLHDIGKGLPGDHTEEGIALAEVVLARIDLHPEDSARVIGLIQHHL